MNGRDAWVRRLGEGLLIVVSILLAFGIDAWWDGQIEEQRFSTQIDQPFVQLEENRRALGTATETGTASRAAATAVGEAIGPEARPMEADSLASLLELALRTDAAEIETAALGAILTDGDLSSRVQPDLQALLVRYRSAADNYEGEGERFASVRASLIQYLNRPGIIGDRLI